MTAVVTELNRLQRQIFETSRLLEYFSERELRYQTGRQPHDWPVVIVKELIDNALDACEDAGVAPEINVEVADDGDRGTITVADNGPGLAPETIERILNFWTRTSDKEAYVSPSRGAQGNALKTIIAIPYVTSTAEPKRGHLTITSRGLRHDLIVETDLLRQEPRIEHSRILTTEAGNIVTVELDYSGILDVPAPVDFYKWLRGYALFNPHATFHLIIPDSSETWTRRAGDWVKWTPSDPTSPWWYTQDDLGRLIASHAVHADSGGRDLTLREFVCQFRGLSSTSKQKQVTAKLSQKRLSEFVTGGAIDAGAVGALLAALKVESRPAKPQHLGVLGETAIRTAIESWYEISEFKYVVFKDFEGELPYVLEIALARKASPGRDDYLGLNFAPTYGDPFGEVRLQHEGSRNIFSGTGIHSLLSELKVQPYDPLVLVVHLAFPRARFRDRGKTGLDLS